MMSQPLSHQAHHNVTSNRRLPAPSVPGSGKLNLEDFDEEINGVNLSKLFSAYGPSSMVDKEGPHGRFGPPRRNKTQGARRPAREASEGKPATAGYPAGARVQNSPYEDHSGEDDEEEPDFSSFDEPIVIRLMANMFAQKKSVREGL
jgi:hypothetical protein